MKKVIIDRLLERFNGMMAQAEADRAFAQQEASSQKGTIGSQHNASAREAQTLAANYQSRIVELNKAICDLRAFAASNVITSERKPDRVQPGVIVTVKNASGQERAYLLLPVGGGEEITIGEKSYKILAPTSPLGWALLNKAPGDAVEFQDQGEKYSLTILAVD